MQDDHAGEFFADTQAHGVGAGAPSMLPRTRLRPLTRRRHVRVPAATASLVERLAWSGVEVEQEVQSTAVSVVPGASRSGRVAVRRPPSGADLDALLGSEELGCRPGRHRQDRDSWGLLRLVPGWRPSPPSWDADTAEPAGPGPAPVEAPVEAAVEAEVEVEVEVEARTATTLERSARGDDTEELPAVAPAPPRRALRRARRRVEPDRFEALPLELPLEPQRAESQRAESQRAESQRAESQRVELPSAELPPADDVPRDEVLDAEIAAAADLTIPVQREHGAEPWYRQRRRRSPAPSLRGELQIAGVRLQRAQGQADIARVAAEEAARLVTADVAALVLRAVEGPRVLWLHPGGPDSGDLWGPATLGALLGVGHPVRRVVEGDPLADGGATALLAVPVPSGGAIAGTLLVRRHDARAFGAVEQDLLSRLARMAGAALLTAARRTAFERGELDDVTRLPGGRRLTGDAAAAVRTADRASMPVSVLAAHVEGLARLRGDLGAGAGDEILAGLALAFAAVLRVGDVAYRIGEDEFALLLPATDAAGVPAIRQRLEAVAAEVVAAHPMPGPPRSLALRTATVPVDVVRAGGDAVDAAVRALDIDRQKVRWTKGQGSVTT